MWHLMTAIRSEKYITMQFRHWVNITYTNLEGIAYCSQATALHSMPLHKTTHDLNQEKMIQSRDKVNAVNTRVSGGCLRYPTYCFT